MLSWLTQSTSQRENSTGPPGKSLRQAAAKQPMDECNGGSVRNTSVTVPV